MFIKKLKNNEKWDNSLVIITADHGIILGAKKHTRIHHKPIQFHIPLVWTGGCVSQDTVVKNFGDQTDIGFTLLNELNINHTPNYYQKDLKDNSWAFYTFNYGGTLLTDSSTNTFNLNSQSYFRTTKTSSDSINTLLMLDHLQTDYNSL